MGGFFEESLLGFVVVACAVATFLAVVAFLAPTVLPEPFATAATRSHVWIVATATLTVVGAVVLLLALRLFI